MFKSLLVAYDFSGPSEAALRLAIEFATEFQSVITLAYVESALEYAIDLEGGAGQMSTTRKQILEEMESVSSRLSELKIDNKVLIKIGNVSDVLVQIAGDLRPDMLFLGAYGFRAAQEDRLGSTAEFMLRSMPGPVLTVSQRDSQIDTPIRSAKSLVYASSLPRKVGPAKQITEALARWSHAHIEVVHAIDARAHATDRRTPVELAEQLEALVQELKDDGLDASAQLTNGEQASSILAVAQKMHAGLIIFGVEHHPAHGALSSISTVIQQSNCPVVTIPGLA